MSDNANLANVWASANGRFSAGGEVLTIGRPTTAQPEPKNKLSAEEVGQVLAICHEPRFASESTFYRVLRRSGEVTRQGCQWAP